MLVGRAVLGARQRHALAGGALAGGGVAAEWAAVEGDALARLGVHVVDGERDVMLDDSVDAHLAAHWEETADVVKKGAHGAREVVAIGGEPLHGRLAIAQQPLTRLADVSYPARLDLWGQLSINASAELVHERGPPIPKGAVSSGLTSQAALHH